MDIIEVEKILEKASKGDRIVIAFIKDAISREVAFELIDLVEFGVLCFDSDTEDSLQEATDKGWNGNKNRSFAFIIDNNFFISFIAENRTLMEYLENIEVVPA